MIAPYYQSDNVTLYCGDCLEVMKRLEPGSVDAVITDPPYGMDIASHRHIGRANGKSGSNEYIVSRWDKDGLDNDRFVEICRVSRLQVVFGLNHLTNVLPPTSGVIVWDKKLKDGWEDCFSDCEVIWTSRQVPARMFRHLWMGACRQSETAKGQGKVHPTQKPIALMCWLVERHANASGTVLDPFMGSGTTGVACVKTGRKFIGIEIDEGYCQIAERRIREAEAQLPMFAGVAV